MRYGIFAAVLSLFLGGKMAAAERFPFSRHQEYAAGTIRPAQFSQERQDADVARYYDRWKGDFLVRENTGSRIAFGKSGSEHRRTVSEGQGYGLIIVALMAGHDPEAREIFDALWKFSRAHPSHIETRLMAWEVPGESGDSAFDGDMDIAYGLLLADRQWGSEGTMNYRAEALRVIAGILAAEIGPESHLPMLGDWVRGSKYTQWQTRPSDFAPGHFRAFRRAAGDSHWDEVVQATSQVIENLQSSRSPLTGLLPDFAVLDADGRARPAPPKFLEAKTDGDYSYNACRIPWRLATDALLNGDVRSKETAGKLSLWIEKSASGEPEKIRAGYHLNGTQLKGGNYFTGAFAAPFGVAAMLNPSQQAWLDRLYAAVCARHEGYYEDTVTLLSLLVMTGHFWDPTTMK
ncbi:MAG: glycosyl hydrolase family 8 [Chthoniobacterales bacterium]